MTLSQRSMFKFFKKSARLGEILLGAEVGEGVKLRAQDNNGLVQGILQVSFHF